MFWMGFVVGALMVGLIACVVRMVEDRRRLANYEALLSEMSQEPEAPMLSMPYQQYRVYLN